MSCPLFVASSFTAYATETDYVKGDLRKIGETVYACTETHTSGTGAIDMTKWVTARNITYNLIPNGSWTLADDLNYAPFDVVENSGTLYMCVKEHLNDGAGINVTDTDYWIVINFDCIIAEDYIAREGSSEYENEGYYFRNERVSYNDKIYAFLPNDNTPSTETPGTQSTIAAGKMWYDISALLETVDTSEEAQRSYNSTTAYSKNQKVEYGDSYYVSTHDNNENNIPGATKSWIAVHAKEPEHKLSDPPAWSAGTYQWGDEVSHNDKAWASRVYANTEEPGTGSNWDARTLIDPTPDCSNQIAFVYNPQVTYQLNDVVDNQGLYYISNINNNIFPLVNTDAWTPCGGSAPDPDCDSQSLGTWTSENYYLKNQVVEFSGSYYIAIANNTNQIPILGGSWEICKGESYTPCGDAQTTEWDNVTTYSQGDKRRWNNRIYISLIDNNLNNQPDLTPVAWHECRVVSYDVEALTDNGGESLIYNESIKAFDQFMDFKSFMYMEVNGKIYNWNTERKTWIQSGGEYGKFHNSTPEKMEIKVVVNDEAQLRTIFDAIRTEADLNGRLFDTVTIRTDFVQNSQTISNGDHHYRLREGIHTMPARALQGPERMRGKWMEVHYSIRGIDGQPFEFRFISTDYLERRSPRM